MRHMRYQVMKGSTPVGVYSSVEEAEDAYQRYGGDDIRELEDTPY